jgi:hypothetical protein
MYLDEDHHITWTAPSEYNSAQECINWYETYKEGLIPEVLKRVEDWIRVERRFEELRDQGKIEITATLKSLE